MKEVWCASSLYVRFVVAAPVWPGRFFSPCSSNQFDCLVASSEPVIAAERSAATVEAEESLMLVVDWLALFAEDADMMPAPFLRRLMPWPVSLSEAKSWESSSSSDRGAIFFLRVLLSAPAPRFLNSVAGISTSAEAAAAAPLAPAMLEVDVIECAWREVLDMRMRSITERCLGLSNGLSGQSQ